MDSKPVCWTCSTGLAHLMAAWGTTVCGVWWRPSLPWGGSRSAPHPVSFLPGNSHCSWDFPSVVNRSQSVHVAAKQEFAAAKYTHDWSTEGTKIRCSGRRQGRGYRLEWLCEQREAVVNGIYCPMAGGREGVTESKRTGAASSESSSPCWLTGWVTALPSFYSFSNQGNSNFPGTSFKAGLDAEHSGTKFPLLTMPCAFLYLFPSRRHNPSKHTVSSWGRKRHCGAVAAPKQNQELQFTADRPCKCLRWSETSSQKKGEVRGKFKLGDFHSGNEPLPCWGKCSPWEHCFGSGDCTSSCCTLRVGRRQPTVGDTKTQELQLLQPNSFLDSEKKTRENQ